jgi:hypothetical protein
MDVGEVNMHSEFGNGWRVVGGRQGDRTKKRYLCVEEAYIKNV